MTIRADIAIIGAGAAGLAAAIFAGEAAAGRGRRILLLDGARKMGAKILVSGGGRCNVTHESVTPDDYWGGPRPIIRNVLRAFDNRRTLEWMRSLGVELKLEPSGKYFPVTDSARTVLEALLGRVRALGVELRTGVRVTGIRPSTEGFEIMAGEEGLVARSRRLIVSTGGLALPKSGSDGTGLEWMKRLGHTIIPTTPALAPLVLRSGPDVGGRFAEFSGITLDLRLTLSAPGGKKLAEQTGSAVFTHFGLSGPAPMNLSRHIARFRLEHPGVEPRVTIGHPALSTPEKADAWLLEQIRTAPKRSVAGTLSVLFPERIARALAEDRGRLLDLNREQRLELARHLSALPLHQVRDRGYSFAETTAGGVDLREIDVRTMESRKVPGLHLCGEILDADGRIGGFNFQWAWATGHLAGRAAARQDG